MCRVIRTTTRWGQPEDTAYKVDHVLTTPIKKYGLTRSDREAHAMVVNALEEVGLRPDETLGRYPHQLSD